MDTVKRAARAALDVAAAALTLYCVAFPPRRPSSAPAVLEAMNRFQRERIASLTDAVVERIEREQRRRVAARWWSAALIVIAFAIGVLLGTYR